MASTLETHHSHEKEHCPECQGELHIRNSKKGAFLGCVNYPTCQYLRPLHEKSDIKKTLPGTQCPLCLKELVLKQGKFGLFVGCSGYPDCQHTAQLSQQDEDKEVLNITCPSCKKGKLQQRQSRYGKTFYACDNYPTCKYAINDKPVNEFCPDCHWPILVERKTTATRRLICPKKGCGYKSKPL